MIDPIALSALLGALTALLTVLLTKGIDAWRTKKLTTVEIQTTERKQEVEERKQILEDAGKVFAEAKRVYDIIIERDQQDRERLQQSYEEVKAELKEVKDELKQARQEHTECLVGQEVLRGDIKELKALVRRLQMHDAATEAQVRTNLAAIHKLAPDLMISDSLPPSAGVVEDKVLPPAAE